MEKEKQVERERVEMSKMGFEEKPIWGMLNNGQVLTAMEKDGKCTVRAILPFDLKNFREEIKRRGTEKEARE